MSTDLDPIGSIEDVHDLALIRPIETEPATYLAEPAITVDTVSIPVVFANVDGDVIPVVEPAVEELLEHPPVAAGSHGVVFRQVLPQRGFQHWARDLAFLPTLATGVLLGVGGIIVGALLGAYHL